MGCTTWSRRRPLYEVSRALRRAEADGALVLRFADGTEQTLVSDGAWKTAAGPITFSNIYGGEDYDARLEQAGWDAAGFDDKGWPAASVVDGPGGDLVAGDIPPVVAYENYEPVAVTHPRPGVVGLRHGPELRGLAGDHGLRACVAEL